MPIARSCMTVAVVVTVVVTVVTKVKFKKEKRRLQRPETQGFKSIRRGDTGVTSNPKVDTMCVEAHKARSIRCVPTHTKENRYDVIVTAEIRSRNKSVQAKQNPHVAARAKAKATTYVAAQVKQIQNVAAQSNHLALQPKQKQNVVAQAEQKMKRCVPNKAKATQANKS